MMNRPTSAATKRKRSSDEDDGFRPPQSPSHLRSPRPAHVGSMDLDRVPWPSAIPGFGSLTRHDRSTNPSTTWADGSSSLNGSQTLDSQSGSIKLLLSDQDLHLLDFPDAPPVTGGGTCELYVAFHRPSNLKLAMKRLRFDFPTEDMLRRFRREAEIWSGFRHPNILPFFGTMKIGHRIYIISPWRQLGDLLLFVQTRLKLIQRDEWLSGGTIIPAYRNFNEPKIIGEIASGLAYLHSIEVVHGDLKAKNVLINDEGHAQICDFGLTKTLSHSVTSTELKGVGSIRWQSPELLQNVAKSSGSDAYAFGMTISEVLTGNYPFPHLKEQTAVIFAIMFRNERPQFKPSSLLGIDFRPLWEIAARCWETKPEDRPQMNEVAQQLESFTSYSIRAVHRLTLNILQSIFLLGSESSWDEGETDFAFTVSQVCQSWRAAATKLPSLWSLIKFNNSPPFKIQSVYLERSKGAALDIVIWGDYDMKQTLQLTQLVRPHVARWRLLEIQCGLNSESYRLFFDELQHEHAPMLESLFVDNGGSIPEWSFRPFGGGTPRLEMLGIGPSQVNRNTTLFSQLTELWIDQDESESSPCSLTTQELLAVLSQCASTIHRIEIHVPKCKPLQQPNLELHPINFPHLQHLTLFDPDESLPTWVPDIYLHIMAPEMRDHDLDVSILGRLAPPTLFPFPNLSKLTISQQDYDANSQVQVPYSLFLHVFSQLRQLQELNVSYVTYFDHNILAHACRGLKKLVFSRSPWSPFGHSGIKDVVELRQLGARQDGTKDTLRYIKLDGFVLQEEEEAWLKRHLEVFQCL